MLMEVRKRCSGCGSDKALDGFYANARGRYGRHSLCKGCMDSKRAASFAAAVAAGDSRVPASKCCPMCLQALPASDFSRHKLSWDGLRTYCRSCERVVRRSGKYGLPREAVEDMLSREACESCGGQFAGDSEKHIDHRHSDGAVRGVLCQRCNTTIGQCEESPEVLRLIAEYLERTLLVDHRKRGCGVTKSDQHAH
jgi:hypothetical protein